ncbi:MAG: ketoacyl-ACP synthase III [Lachnospiraceae bacterium]|nr:ketoacyl-ACP synthase III [Lachnospiraceae bacterium]
MTGYVEGIKIKGIRAAVPTNIVNNKELLESATDRRLHKQIKLTGIFERRVTVGNQKASDLASIAAEQLLTDLCWDRDSIDVLVFVTQSGDLSRPASAMLIHNRLKLGQNCLAFDMNMGCAGFIGGLETVSGMLSVTKGKGLLLVGESNAVLGDDSDHNSFLDGDAAAAIALEYVDGASPIDFAHYSDGSRACLLYKPFDRPSYMDGNAIMFFGLSEVANTCKDYMQCQNITDSDIDYYVFHQAQKMIIDGIVDDLQIPKEKVLISCDRYGNTSSASIPLTIVSELCGIGSGKKRIFACGFGIGLSWGISVFDINIGELKPVIESDYCYKDRECFERKDVI